LEFLVFHDFPFWLHMYHLWLPRIALHSCINSLDFFLCMLIVNFWKIGLSHSIVILLIILLFFMMSILNNF
jgi:hypothetical protein